MREGAEDGLKRKMTLPGRQVRELPGDILKVLLYTIFLINLAQFPLEGEENP